MKPINKSTPTTTSERFLTLCIHSSAGNPAYLSSSYGDVELTSDRQPLGSGRTGVAPLNFRQPITEPDGASINSHSSKGESFALFCERLCLLFAVSDSGAGILGWDSLSVTLSCAANDPAASTGSISSVRPTHRKPSVGLNTSASIGFEPQMVSYAGEAGAAGQRNPFTGIADVPPSGLTDRLAKKLEQKKNPFSEYLQFAGDGLVDSDRVHATIFIPFASTPAGRQDPIEPYIACRATVREAIGLCLYMYTDQARIPELQPNVEMYELRMVEDDCEPDLDLPPLACTPDAKALTFCHGDLSATLSVTLWTLIVPCRVDSASAFRSCC